MKGGGGKAEMGVGKEELVSEANILIMKSRIKKGTNERVVVVFVQHLLNVTDGLNKYFHHSRRRRRRREEFLSSVVNAIKHFFGGNLENLDSPMDEQAIIRHFKSNKQCYSIVKLKKALFFTFLCWFRHPNKLYSISYFWGNRYFLQK